MFPTPVRFAGLAISYNVSTSLFGGTAPAFNSWMIGLTGDVLVPAYVMMASCLIGMAALPFVIETAGQSLSGTEILGTSASKRQIGNERPIGWPPARPERGRWQSTSCYGL